MQRRTSTPVALDHVSLEVRDIRAARGFYTAALGAIGMKVNLDFQSAFGMGSNEEKVFWLARDAKASGRGHYALRVPARADVDAFYAAAMKAGGKDNGKPGLRPHYGPNYYAAFVKDGEGNNIEVVCYARARSTRPTVARSGGGTSRRTEAKSRPTDRPRGPSRGARAAHSSKRRRRRPGA